MYTPQNNNTPVTPTNPSPSVFGNVVFTIPAGTLPPGQAQAYTMTNAFNRPFTNTAITVPLGVSSSNAPFDLNKSIVLTSTQSPISGNHTLDAREPANTVIIAIELSAAGSGILSKIECLELDCAYSPKRPVTPSDVVSVTDPFPIQLFRFQISRPGVDYAAFLPPVGSPLGIRNSTLRTFADFNLRAQSFPRPIAGYLSPPYFMDKPDNLSALPFSPPGGLTGGSFTSDLAFSPIPWGHSANTGPTQTILFDTPQEFVSLAQFQHADLTASNSSRSVATQPGNALGNSYAPHLVKRGLSFENRFDYTVSSLIAFTALQNRYFDMSYLLNVALWDSFFLSTVPTSGAITPRNPRINEIQEGSSPTDLRDPLRASSKLWVQGGFNINSTRPDAWKALLASNNKLLHPAESNIQDSAMFPRSLSQTGEAQLPMPSGDGNDSLNGFRRLTSAHLDTLASEISRQVRLRGPFVSLSHFINRSLLNLSPSTKELSRSGALQSAIDGSDLNLSPSRSSTGFVNLSPANNQVQMQAYSANNQLPEADMVGTGRVTQLPPKDASDPGPAVWPLWSKDGNPGNTGSMLADRALLTDPAYRSEQGFRSTGIPGWLTQADVLQVIGPIINARSDTFRIRSYGEALDPAGRTLARAYCEAIVQRLPNFLDPSNLPETRPSILNPTNAKFGRRFEIVSFRWLHPDEI
jgi:hypothetical protein